MLAVGGNPVGTLTECLEQSIVKEAAKGYWQNKWLKNYHKTSQISKTIRNEIEIAGNAGDDVSEDMFIGMQTSVDKHNWMFKSYLS
ncbi:ferritin-like domain-containing protein [Staphylococcus aureus]